MKMARNSRTAPEQNAITNTAAIKQSIRKILTAVGEDPQREGLKETPDRVARAYLDMLSGYRVTDSDIRKMLKIFRDGATDEMVVVRNIEFTSFCEHHMLPFQGVAHVGYLPSGSIAGLSKFARLVDAFASRLQVQERLTTQIVTAIDTHLSPVGAGCVIEAKHLCMSCRGVKKKNSSMITSALRGVFKTDAAVRSEFLSFIQR